MKTCLALALAFAVVAPVAVKAESQEEQYACMNDAFAVCGHAIPDRDRVAQCLAANINRISPQCRAVMVRYSRPPARGERWTDRSYRY